MRSTGIKLSGAPALASGAGAVLAIERHHGSTPGECAGSTGAPSFGMINGTPDLESSGTADSKCASSPNVLTAPL
jgi:hypothetical protein